MTLKRAEKNISFVLTQGISLKKKKVVGVKPNSVPVLG